MNKVFVYGSLKKGYHNYPVLKDSEYLGTFKTKGKYDMFSLGSFPAVIKNSHNYFINGELYSVTDEVLNDLDELEGNGYFYKRYLTPLQGYDEDVWVYFYLNKDHGDSKECVTIKGDEATWV